MAETIRWGILGPGKIAHSFANDLKLVDGGVLTAVASRSLDRATSFATEYGAEYAFGSYEALLKSSEVDVVYIATPHTGHEEWAIKAMEHGKHVLCEKPLGVNHGQVQNMVGTAKDKNVFLMEALWSRFNPSIKKIKEWVDVGKLGKIRYLHADFAFYGLDRDEKGRLLTPELAGGSLLDIGIYPIFLAYLILGMPEKILSCSNFYKTGAEVQTSMIFKYGSAQALLYSGLTSSSEMRAEIQGSNGSIFLEPRWHETQGFTVVLNDQKERNDLPTTGKGYAHEIEEVHACLGSGKLQSGLWNHQNSLDLISLMDKVRKQTGIVFPFER
ncbi:Gfo/Idh/MocA family oxidoreductase [Flavobacteriaceae bacterium TP-CH-4]|uniref:Gfo/Idh/MocA family oxidoreductase n=1 Tax=Pelagihabitans pacificus TaxID=2696054 RepID=A0A967E599_9FLAO|nr:Gfo/Idh/MocA family oxidoreductase [Pelagihabitans pacificus]NHF59222.1 Gfo/Idh/MocA family oxidoreductase [Pelagihabitans pacificus]